MPRRPTSDEGREEWRAYWTAQGMSWRTEPEIDEERQWYLAERRAERRAVQPDSEQSLFPFRDEHGSIKLARADVEWLVATHSTGAPLPPSRLSGRNYSRPFGPDLRGANLDGVNLADMPLHLARLDYATLRGATLDGAHLDGADLDGVDCTGATLRGTALVSAGLCESTLVDADLSGAHLYQASLREVDLRRANLRGADLSSAWVVNAQLAEVDLTGAFMTNAVLDGGNLHGIHLDPDTAADLLGEIVSSLPCDIPDMDWATLPLASIEWSRLFRMAEVSIVFLHGLLDGGPYFPLLPPESPEAEIVKRHRVLARNYLRLAAVWSEHNLAEYAAHLVQRADVLRQEVVRRGEDPDYIDPDS